ncbi:MAG: hypothetical protein QMD46_13410 [Methanomicrobiales archaeon]|nr:hypothetical protein [Methanomicrobiales archaeon]
MTEITIRAGDLHKALGDYPGPNQRMPVCCSAMYQAMEIGDEIVKAPHKGKGANLYIRYRLPRPGAVEMQENLRQVLPRSPAPQVFADLEYLMLRHPEYAALNQISDLAKATPATVVSICRTIVEQITRMVCTRHGIQVKGMTLDEMCGMVKAYELLDPRALAYLNTLRIMGNKAVHAETEFLEQDRIIICSILHEYLLAVLEKNLI